MAAHKYITDLTADCVRSILDYDPETGIFRWKWREGLRKSDNTRRAEKVAGSLTSNGYIALRINRQDYQAHRLVWLYVHGVWPADQIDHINGDRADNRIANLREATNQENARNADLRKTNSTGVVGVYWDKRHQKYYAGIIVNDKSIYLGLFSTLEEAAIVRAAAEIKYFGGFRNQSAGQFVLRLLCSATNSSPAPAGAC
jgi:hypothetical protein